MRGSVILDFFPDSEKNVNEFVGKVNVSVSRSFFLVIFAGSRTISNSLRVKYILVTLDREKENE
jgi:hypothetical protein